MTGISKDAEISCCIYLRFCVFSVLFDVLCDSNHYYLDTGRLLKDLKVTNDTNVMSWASNSRVNCVAQFGQCIGAASDLPLPGVWSLSRKAPV